MGFLKMIVRKGYYFLLIIAILFFMTPQDLASAVICPEPCSVPRITVTKKTENNEFGDFTFRIKAYDEVYELILSIYYMETCPPRCGNEGDPGVIHMASALKPLILNNIEVNGSSGEHEIFQYLDSINTIEMKSILLNYEGQYFDTFAYSTDARVMIDGQEYELYVSPDRYSVDNKYPVREYYIKTSEKMYADLSDEFGNQVDEGVYEFNLASGESRTFDLNYKYEIIEVLQDEWLLDNINGDSTLTVAE